MNPWTRTNLPRHWVAAVPPRFGNFLEVLQRVLREIVLCIFRWSVLTVPLEILLGRHVGELRR